MSDDFYGLNIRLIVAGLSGGSIYSYLLKKAKPGEILGGLMVGGLSANYLGQAFSDRLGTPLLASAFLVGLVGMVICRRIIKFFGTWEPFKGK